MNKKKSLKPEKQKQNMKKKAAYRIIKRRRHSFTHKRTPVWMNCYLSLSLIL
ncbi:hypothetical protein RUMTOR_02393 [[Ruminococcus] torques ATCC 27756]|uniref:Uncharacterized protein n=1 Tax=[Ruminococcus] torques ATCC 27756 TaxID=411460 RepID=A5KQ56_9FIRM|nr:hypothetical protein RUMTOR_02393 [[Ruminococcus] torques ATCC 27756]